MTTLDASTIVRLTRVEAAVPSLDGTWLAVAVQRLDDEAEAKYVGDLWRVPLDGTAPTRLTSGKSNDHSPAFLHDGSLAFLSNRPTGKDDDGHEKRSQVFAFRPQGGDPVCLTHEPLGVSRLVASRTTDVFFVATALLPGVALDEQRKTAKDRAENGPSALVYDDMPVRFWDHWLPDRVPHIVVYREGERLDLTPDAGAEMHRAEWTIAPGGEFVVLHPSRPGADRIPDENVDIIDAISGARRELLAEPRTWFGGSAVANAADRIAMTRHRRVDGAYGASELIVVDVATGAITELVTGVDTRLSAIRWLPDDSRFLASGPLNTHHPVFVVDASSGDTARVTAESAGGTHLSVDLAGDTVVGVRSSVTQAPEPFACALRPDAEPWLLASLSGFGGADFAVVEDCTVVSTDGVPVQYRVVRPSADGPHPCLLAIHGGPIADWGDIWHWRWNSLVWAAAGFAVALPNPRGSVGFGQDFIEGIWNNQWGAQCYEDLMAVADALAARPDVDERRMVALGGSFGGYMTNWIGSQTDRFRCLVTHASIFDMAAFHGVTDMPAWWAFSFGVHPYAERREFDRYSPIAHIANWKSPTLVIHGDRDFRVPIGESLALFEGLRFHGVHARLLVFPDENHWILKPRNIESWHQHVLDFVRSHT